MLRALAAWFELANVDEMLAALAGRPAGAEFELGALATAWPRIREADSRAALRAALAASEWRDPGGDTDRAVRLGMRARYAARAAALPGPVRDWAAAAMALLVAGELCAGGQAGGALFDDAPGLLGPAALGAVTLAELAGGLPPSVRWVLDGVTTPDGLWRAEATWRSQGGAGRAAAAAHAPPWTARSCSARWPSWRATPGGSARHSRWPRAAARRLTSTKSWPADELA